MNGCSSQARNEGMLYIACPQQDDLSLLGPPSGQGAGDGARTRDKVFLQISGRIRYPLCHRRPTRNEGYNCDSCKRQSLEWKEYDEGFTTSLGKHD
ncbi:hypothetical protein PoB_004423900 [Plakobranchus ocellatus]|uniref:Uncharacterized protein n=1 Tax=Plakobranchus ocellatus TaxID=259542 RepID=A0AAV4BC48_9GAST|nr:hypothetical protein PoB_004423900 [Plakobranchus ocellatus]